MISIEITSDIACPWCYIGHKRLENAIKMFQSEHKDVTFEITEKPYMIDKNTKSEGEEYLAVCFFISTLFSTI